MPEIEAKFLTTRDIILVDAVPQAIVEIDRCAETVDEKPIVAVFIDDTDNALTFRPWEMVTVI